jgi:hypothetical protein
MQTDMQPRRDALAKPGDSGELIKLIRKLRWIGMDEEARRAQADLASRSTTDCVLAGPTDKD